MTTKPKKYQLEGVQAIKDFEGRALLADETGLGKTIQALLFAKQSKARPIIVVCPAFLKTNWKHEATIHVGMQSQIISGRRVSKRWKQRAPILIINYEILGAWLDKLISLDPELIIIDEGHRIGNPKTKQTKNVTKLANVCQYRIVISATPFEDRPAQLFPILSLLRPDKWKSFWSFAAKYCEPRLTPWGWEYKGATRMGELNRRLKRRVMIRRRVDDVAEEIPKLTRSVVLLDVKGRKEYREAEENFIRWLSKQSRARAKRAKRAKRLVKRGYLKRLAAQLKLVYVREWVQEMLNTTHEKIILFGIHRSLIMQLHEWFPQESLVLHGNVTGHKRDEVVASFTKSKKRRLLIANLKAAGVGWNGQAARHVAFFELPWVPSDCKQGEGRVRRIGQHYPTFAHYLVARDTVEELLCELLQRKQSAHDQAIDGKDGSGDSGLSIMDELDRLLERKRKRRAA